MGRKIGEILMLTLKKRKDNIWLCVQIGKSSCLIINSPSWILINFKQYNRNMIDNIRFKLLHTARNDLAIRVLGVVDTSTLHCIVAMVGNGQFVVASLIS